MATLKKGIIIILTITLIATTFITIGTIKAGTKGCVKHSYTTVYEPTNKSNHVKIKKCKKCGFVAKRTKEKHSTKSVIPGTANAKTHVIVSKCRFCGKITNHGYANHTWKNNKCTVCGYKRK